MHWSRQYIGAPYAESPGAGEFNCWTLVVDVQRRIYGREVPHIHPGDFSARSLVRMFREHDELERWRELAGAEHLSDGDVVLMSHSRAPHHCGIYLSADGGRILHAEEGVGVVAQSFTSLRSCGWGAFRSFTYAR